VSARAVVFDLDGTLVDSLRDLATALNATLAHISPATPPLPLETVRAFVGDGAGILVARTLARAGLSVRPEEVLPVFLERYAGCLLASTVLFPGVREALDALRPRHLAVLTNKPGNMSRAILAGLGVAERFFRIYGGGDLATRKPDPAGLLRLLAEVGVPPEEAMMVGDSAVDVRTGRAAGVRTVGVTYGLDPEGLRQEGPDHLLGDLRDLGALV
jgi:phosphoglycolate phosphatase